MTNNKKLSTEGLNLYFSEKHILKDVAIGIPQNKITALIGPSGCGKTTLLRTFNRLHDLLDYVKITGKVMIDDTNIYDPKISAVEIRKRIGMVFQKPNPFPKNIYDNIAYGLKVNNTDPYRIPQLVEQSLRESFLWDEVKDELKKPAIQLSGGQQQRLCIARAVALRPEVILMDEPCSALDPFSSLKIEDLIRELRKSYTVVIVTHNMQQAQRLSDYTAFMYLGQLIEFGTTKEIFNNPQHDLTKNYVTGHFG
ncbi:phosphate ABC transporter ATP-binding protein [Niastella vici]|uniref:Phosphate ABC transporter ATP-binding protein n=1 Tax=Niastella vici TaxID=1703345 RepID=A0A1V9G036_9BACT|nr:phosphate ABC transporter ATP-binding protein PstB [Niastella vici]OQP63856.1 phosphate ABC transporter ATP-binding protein [Niastella vici]